MLYTDLLEIKGVLEIPLELHVEDKRILWWVEQLSKWIEDVIFCRDLSYKVRTQFLNGAGTQRLNLKNRPVYPETAPPFALALPFQALTVWTDAFGYFGSSPQGPFPDPPLVYGQDYCLQLDQDDGSSRSGILIRTTDYWPRPYARQTGLLTPFLVKGIGNVKVSYTAGYTVDTLPGQVRLALDQLLAQTRYLFPLGILLASESYEDRAISALNERRDGMLALAKPLLHTLRNWVF